jgi:predicted amidohydrolase
MKLRLAGLQTPGHPGEVEENLHELDVAAHAAVSGGADILVTPELFLTGYDIGDRVRHLADRDLIGSACAVAANQGIALIVGLPEFDATNTLYNSAFFIDPAGAVLGRHRKTHLFGELDRKYFAAGSEAVTVVDYLGVRIGMMICYDVEFPENVRMSALRGAQLLAVPTAQMKPFEFVADCVIRTRAWENQIYVAYINHDGIEGDTVYVGRSSIVAPDATVLDRIETGRGLIYGTVDTDILGDAQRRNPYLRDLRPSLNGHLVQSLAGAK